MTGNRSGVESFDVAGFTASVEALFWKQPMRKQKDRDADSQKNLMLSLRS
jgi:hypothetical protein